MLLGAKEEKLGMDFTPTRFQMELNWLLTNVSQWKKMPVVRTSIIYQKRSIESVRLKAFDRKSSIKSVRSKAFN